MNHIPDLIYEDEAELTKKYIFKELISWYNNIKQQLLSIPEQEPIPIYKNPNNLNNNSNNNVSGASASRFDSGTNSLNSTKNDIYKTKEQILDFNNNFISFVIDGFDRIYCEKYGESGEEIRNVNGLVRPITPDLDRQSFYNIDYKKYITFPNLITEKNYHKVLIFLNKQINSIYGYELIYDKNITETICGCNDDGTFCKLYKELAVSEDNKKLLYILKLFSQVGFGDLTEILFFNTIKLNLAPEDVLSVSTKITIFDKTNNLMSCVFLLTLGARKENVIGKAVLSINTNKISRYAKVFIQFNFI